MAKPITSTGRDRLKTISNQQRGFTLLEGLAGLSLLMTLLTLGSQHLQRRLEQQLSRHVAEHLRMVADAAERYLLDSDSPFNRTTQEKEAWTAEQQKISKNPKRPIIGLEEWRYQQLIKNKYLPEGFNRTNLYGQDYAIYVKIEQEPQPHLQLLVMTTGGKPIKEGLLRQSARHLGYQGGYLSQNNTTNTITGNQRGWQLPLPTKTRYQPATTRGNTQPTAEPTDYEQGHLASLRLLYDSDLLRRSALLHRTATSPQSKKFNQMATDLNLQKHEIIFEDKDKKASGTLSASIMELTSPDQNDPDDKKKLNQVKLACDASNPEITVANSAGTLSITAQKVEFVGQKLTEKWRRNHTIEGYSPPALYRYWNKVAYYELKDNENNKVLDFATSVCKKKSTAPVSPSELIPGRLFMIGTKSLQTTYLYICTTDSKKEPQAHLLKSMEPSSNPP